MPITALRINGFRNLNSVDIDPVTMGLNIICGKNGSGKTSLLESVHYLGTGRSFRTSTASRLIQHHQDKFSLFTQVSTNHQHLIPLGVERDQAGASRMRMNDSDHVSMADLASCLPLRLIHSQSHQLFESGPTHRRKFLDWGLFYHHAGFLGCWRQYERALKQRNAVLQARRPKRELDPWTEALVAAGLSLDQYRADYVAQLQHELAGVSSLLLPELPVTLTYLSGWTDGVTFADSLTSSYHDDMRLGVTKFGPHRAELDILIDGVLAKQFLSRGQQKLLICAMIIAQGKLMARQANQGLIYLVDDLPSELDHTSRQRLWSLLADQNSQVFVTAIDAPDGANSELSNLGVPMKVFHVEHGRVAEVATVDA